MAALPPIFARRRAGVLLHIASLPGRHGIGDLGLAAHDAAAWCARAGMSVWQVLPIGPVGPGNSPYASASSFAGEPLFVSLDLLQRDGLLTRAECSPLAQGRARYAVARAFKLPRLATAHQRWVARRGHRAPAFVRWRHANAPWLRDWCRYAATQAHASTDPQYHAFVQWQFAQQWARLQHRCREHGVMLLGDVPIFVPLDSADVWAHPELFRLDAQGRPTVVTGVPPDCFSATGQLWGHPHYAWQEHQRTRFRWWIARIQHALSRFDALRIDHFVGLVHAFEIPGRARTARTGRWRATPGAELLTALQKACERLPLVAEDLGAVTPKVTALREQFGLPGMRLVQGAFDAPGSPDLPCNHPVRSVAYPGTHDNPTATGWWQGLPPRARGRFRAYCGGGGGGGARAQACASLVRATLQSPAQMAVIPMQDLLAAPPAARMNRPGAPRGQWEWRASPDALSGALADSIRLLAEATARA